MLTQTFQPPHPMHIFVFLISLRVDNCDQVEPWPSQDHPIPAPVKLSALSLTFVSVLNLHCLTFVPEQDAEPFVYKPKYISIPLHCIQWFVSHIDPLQSMATTHNAQWLAERGKEGWSGGKVSWGLMQQLPYFPQIWKWDLSHRINCISLVLSKALVSISQPYI